MRFDCPHCKKTLNVKDELAGKKGKCPSCGGAITIPEPEIGVLPDGPLQQEQTPSQEQGIGPAASGEACPKCFQPMAADAVVCIQCGYDTRTKKALRTEFGAEEPPGEMRVPDGTLPVDQAMKALRRPFLIIGVCLAVAVCTIIVMFLSKGNNDTVAMGGLAILLACFVFAWLVAGTVAGEGINQARSVMGLKPLPMGCLIHLITPLGVFALTLLTMWKLRRCR